MTPRSLALSVLWVTALAYGPLLLFVVEDFGLPAPWEELASFGAMTGLAVAFDGLAIAALYVALEFGYVTPLLLVVAYIASVVRVRYVANERGTDSAVGHLVALIPLTVTAAALLGVEYAVRAVVEASPLVLP